MTIPPMVKTQSPLGSGGTGLPPVEDVDMPTFEFNLDAVAQAMAKSQSLGFPGPSQAFLNDPPLIFSLLVEGPNLLPSVDLPQTLPNLALAERAIGSLPFGTLNDPDAVVNFRLELLVLVPEPNGTALTVAAVLMLLSTRRIEFAAK